MWARVFPFFSLSLSPLYLILYFLLLSFFLYILVHDENERTNEKEYPRLRNIYQPPVGSSGNIVGHAIAWAKKKKKGKKPLALFLFFFNIDIYIGERKKNLQVLYSSSELIVGTAVAAVQRHDSSFPNHFLKPPTTSNPTGILLFSPSFFSIFLFFFFSPLRILNVIFFPLSLMYIVSVYIRRWSKENAWRKPPGRTVCGPLFFFLHPNAAAFIITRTTYMYTIYIFTVYSYPLFFKEISISMDKS